MAEGLLYNVVADLTVGKPEAVEFPENGSLRDAIAALANCMECGIPIWKENPHAGPETPKARQGRFVGILSAMDIVAHLSREGSLRDPAAALQAPVADIVIPNNALLRQVDPATSLGEAVEIMGQGVRRLLVPLPRECRRFSVLYDGQWLHGADEEPCGRWCCLSREDVVRFLIGRLGALAPLPLTPIQALGAISRRHVESFSLDGGSAAREAVKALAGDPQAAPVVEQAEPGGGLRLIGEISAFKLWKCDFVAAGWALANLSAAEFVMGVADAMRSPVRQPPPFEISSKIGGIPLKSRIAAAPADGNPAVAEEKQSRFSTRPLDLLNVYAEKSSPRPYNKVGDALLTCRPTNSLAAVMAQMLSHRATHVWVTQQGDAENLIGIVAYADILSALTRPSTSASPN